MIKEEEENLFTTDILVIGGGGAGLRAAIESFDNGAKVIVLSKSLMGKAHTVMAEGGIAAALGNVDREDNWKIHFKDTFEDGQKIADPKMVELLCKQAPQSILELEKWGAIFDRSNSGKIMQRAFGAHSYKRVCHVADRTGLEIIQTLLSQTKKRKIKFLEETIVTKILVKNNKVVGANVLDLKKGKLILIKTKSIILASGGLCRSYLTTSNSWETTGDGFALAYNAGAELKDMEMIQFHPTGMVFPKSAKGILVTESVRGEGGILTNSKGERFMEKYDKKRMELSARDVVARAVFREVKEGRGTKNGGVYLDISHKSEKFIFKKIPKMVKQFEDFANIDIVKEKMEVYPTAHYMMGGVNVTAQTCETAVEGLFACGEVASGVHGANRLGGNSLADILVFGKLAGKSASNYSNKTKFETIERTVVEKENERISKPFNSNGGESSSALKKKVQEIMWNYVGLERNEKGLNNALKLLKEIEGKAKNTFIKGNLIFNIEWLAWFELQNMFVTCTAIIKSALMRKESRGAHTRSDFSKSNQKFMVNILNKDDNGKMKIYAQNIKKFSELA